MPAGRIHVRVSEKAREILNGVSPKFRGYFVSVAIEKFAATKQGRELLRILEVGDPIERNETKTKERRSAVRTEKSSGRKRKEAGTNAFVRQKRVTDEFDVFGDFGDF